MKVSIVIPVHNEQDSIVEVISKVGDALDGTDYELVVVDDHSADSTVELVKKLLNRNGNIKLVENKLEKGFANALKTGFYNINAEVVVPVMGDLCDDLSTIKKMLAKINEGYDVVCGSRYTQGGARIGGHKIKGVLSSFVSGSLYHILRLPTRDIPNAFKMYKKKVIDKVETASKSFEISMELALKAHYLGFKITEVPTVWRERSRGKSNFSLLQILPNYLRLYIWAIFKNFTNRRII